MSLLEQVLTALIVFAALWILALLAFVSLRLTVDGWVEARRVRFDHRWEGLLDAWMAGDKTALPALQRGQRVWLLRLWNRTRNYVEGEAAEFLGELATATQLDTHAAGMLTARAPWKRVLAAITLGELRASAHWTWLRPLLADPHVGVALATVEAMIRIDPRRAAPEVIPALLAHGHWDPVRTGRLLRALGPEAVEPLRVALAATGPGDAERILRWLGLTEELEVLPLLRGRLAGGASDGEATVILEAIGRFGGAEDRVIALHYLGHPDWRVRMQAGSALGKVGLPEDRERIEAMLVDPVWWVRYRAAGALYRLRGETLGRFRALAAKHPDPYAREALQRVLAEHGKT